MGCCDCGCINKLDHVEKVIADYDPTEKFINYKLLTIWLNRKTRQAYILVSKKDGIAVWEPINLDINAIEKILLDCGEAAPNEKGEIRLKGECGVRAEAEGCEKFYFDLFTADPLTGGKRVYLGDEVNLGFRADIAGDVRGPDSATVGNVPVYKDTTGKTITTSNINSIDGLTSITKSTAGEQKLLVETADTESGSDAGIEAKSTGNGTPYFQLTQGENKWRRIINPETGALEVRPIDDLSKGSILSMLPNGVTLMPWQPKCTAVLNQRTPNFTANIDYEIGSTRAFVKLRDTDGYNQSANNFFPGDGNGNSAYYTCPYSGGYSIGWLFLADRTTALDNKGEILFKLIFGTIGNPKVLIYRYFFGSLTYSTVSGYITLPLEKGDRIRWNINIRDIPQGTPYINSITEEGQIDNFIGILFAG